MIEKSNLIKEFFEKGKSGDCPVYDLHGHMGPFYGAYMPYPEPEEMVKMMDRAGVRMLVFCHHATLMTTAGNKPNIEAVRKFPDRLRAYCAVNPNFPEMLSEDLESFDEHRDVYVGFKFLADYHCVPVNDVRYEPAWKFADDRNLLMLLHTWGGSSFDDAEIVRKAVEKYKNVKVLLGHSCHGDWDGAIKLVKDFPNVYLELTAVLDDRGILEKFVEEAGSERIIFGTDFPWFSHHYYIGCVLSADITDEDRHNILHRNAEKLLSPFLNKDTF